jgi:hypothetical protein
MFSSAVTPTFYSFEKLTKLANYKPYDTLSLLEAYCTRTKPRLYISKKALVPPKIHGDSWLIHPYRLISSQSAEDAYKYQYLALASKRDYTLYLTYKVAHLPISFFPDIQLEKIRFNPLLTISNNNIHFKYEE